MKQKLGEKKHKKCEELTGRKFTSCWTRGGWGHFNAQCWTDRSNAIMVNYKTGETKPCVVGGQIVY